MSKLTKLERAQKLEKLKNILKPRNIKVESKEYINTDTYVNCECVICKWKWATTPYHLKNRKQGCPNCAGRTPKPFEKIKSTLLERNISILIDKYPKNAYIKVPCLCLFCSWNWQTAITDLVNNETGCPKCSGRIPKPLEEIKEILLKRNITILIDKYPKNNSTKVPCLCLICKYKWSTKIAHLVNSKSGCPNCKVGFGEKSCRFIFETLLNKKFPKVRPDWLRYKKKLELDGFCTELNLAFEHNGRQHYEFAKQFHKTENFFVKQQERDFFKKEKCKEYGVILIEVDNRNEYGFQELVEIIKIELRNKNIKFNEDLELNETGLYEALRLAS